MRAAAAAKELTQINDGISVECARSPDRLLPFRSLICFSVYNCIRLVAYLFIAGKVFPHWNRRTGTHGNHCHQYTDRNQIDHFPAAFFFSFNVYLFFIVRLNNDSRFAFLSLLLKHSLSLLNSFFSLLLCLLFFLRSFSDSPFTRLCTISKCLFLIYSDECTFKKKRIFSWILLFSLTELQAMLWCR